MNATVVISTKNRKQDLHATVLSAVTQSANPEVLVIDDGSTDGTLDMLRSEFPSVRVERSEQSKGYIVQRNRGASLATGEVIFSVDDDATFSTPTIIEQTLAEFNHPRIGAVAIPFINVKKETIIWQKSPDPSQIYCTGDYIGTAHAVRRDLFLKLGSYREQLFHQGEERDFCIRLLDAGYLVRLGNSDPIHHFESPRRDFRRMDLFGRRNDILFATFNVPFPYFIPHALLTTIKGFLFGFKVHRPANMTRGLLTGWRDTFALWSTRAPVRPSTYKLFRQLQKSPTSLIKIEALLPKVQ